MRMYKILLFFQCKTFKPIGFSPLLLPMGPDVIIFRDSVDFIVVSIDLLPAPILDIKVMENLSHINKRVKHTGDILMPTLDLWNLYTESVSSAFVSSEFVYCGVDNQKPRVENSGAGHPTQHLISVWRKIGCCNQFQHPGAGQVKTPGFQVDKP
ncbi:hypothetical protein EJB05_33520, partial [Eragrostis curvula]